MTVGFSQSENCFLKSELGTHTVLLGLPDLVQQDTRGLVGRSDSSVPLFFAITHLLHWFLVFVSAKRLVLSA